MAIARRVVILCSVAAAYAAHAAPPGPAPASPPSPEPSLAERRAVRGAPVEATTLYESPELREVRRFEETSFARGGRAGPPAFEDVDQPLPPGLIKGRWGGSGDVPREIVSPVPWSPGQPPAPGPDAPWLNALAPPELPLRWEPQVLRYLNYFKSDPKGRAIMTTFLRKLGRYRALFERIFDREGVPRDLIYLAMIESGFETGAVSRVGAQGLWQFMPGTGRAYGLEVSHWVDARRDPERATQAAAIYLKDLYVRFGSWHLAFAAYHAGYGAILRSITNYNTNDYWELCRHEAGLPWETTLYVPKILAAALVGHNLAAFGYSDVIQDPPWSYEAVAVPPGTTLAAVARGAATRSDVIESLNPHLVRARTPPDRGNTAVRVPVGAGALYAQAMGAARGHADLVESVVLRFGESLDDVARARGVTLRELKKLNGIKYSAEVPSGTTLVVPLRPAGGGAATPSPAATASEEDVILVALPERSFEYPDRERVFYRTRAGDTLEGIAGALRVAIDELVEWNHLDTEAKIQPRMVLQVFVRKDLDRAGLLLLDPAKLRLVTLGSEEFLALQAARRGKTRLYYTARAGDTFAKIARRYGLELGDLARINRLSAASELTAGQQIVVYSPTPDLPRELTVGRSPRPRRPSDRNPPAAVKARK